MKVGIIRCQLTEDNCHGEYDYDAASQGKYGFHGVGRSEVVGFTSCGGCPGSSAAVNAKLMIGKGAEGLAFASCVEKGNPAIFGCPYYEEMKQAISAELGNSVKLINYTH